MPCTRKLLRLTGSPPPKFACNRIPIEEINRKFRSPNLSRAHPRTAQTLALDILRSHAHARLAAPAAGLLGPTAHTDFSLVPANSGSDDEWGISSVPAPSSRVTTISANPTVYSPPERNVGGVDGLSVPTPKRLQSRFSRKFQNTGSQEHTPAPLKRAPCAHLAEPRDSLARTSKPIRIHRAAHALTASFYLVPANAWAATAARVRRRRVGHFLGTGAEFARDDTIGGRTVHSPPEPLH
ncbi:hypothetical protein DFH06DRAFT_1468079 [Mycena polygramma]|nr:hypothetical protein DFH06DRAFT_1468079 [Mycena polygramma]